MTRDDTHSRKVASRRTIIRTGLASGLSIAGLTTSAAAADEEHENESESNDEQSEDDEQSDDDEQSEDDDDEPAAEITFTDQETPGGSVTVDHVYMEEGGFVSIHDRRRHDGEVLGSIIGITEFLEPGDHSDVSVPFFTANATAPGPDAGQDADGLVEGQALIAIPHRDGNDSGVFDGEPDPAYQNGPRTLDQFGAVNDNATVSVADSTE